MMSGRKMVVGLAVLALLWGSAAGEAQQTRYGIEEWNAFQDTNPQVTQDPAERLQKIGMRKYAPTDPWRMITREFRTNRPQQREANSESRSL